MKWYRVNHGNHNKVAFWSIGKKKKRLTCCLSWLAGVGPQPKGNFMIYSLLTSPDRQEANESYLSVHFWTG